MVRPQDISLDIRDQRTSVLRAGRHPIEATAAFGDIPCQFQKLSRTNFEGVHEIVGSINWKLRPQDYRRIQKVQKAAERAAKNETRFADYRYLRSVLAAHTYFEDNNLLSHVVAIAPSMLTTPVRADSCPLRVTIDATCIQPDLRMRSRWTRALEFAVQEQIEPQALARFMSAHSGISGCADLASKPKPKKIT
ncbi:hypothetical protein [Bradyrhizobium sp. CCBAU 11357]|uniref:hypothetical protein n=1 Tax=Bradyrhizobium sp. CCBAU 11357 TaxID=1630808 RepID=UPI0023032609|nr:hypothetical protein [Bradyrhizobium sp. CCBAU 11357]